VLASTYNGSDNFVLAQWYSHYKNAGQLAWELRKRVDDDRYGRVLCPVVIYTVFFAPEHQQQYWSLLGQVCVTLEFVIWYICYKVAIFVFFF
jgi:hypothetical protein